ncbi:hypothetical protein [Candidatus Synechococcus spongiarum]|uniref:Uncharacterized protein n=1 Tax=Candidatus Synechococcus spongiarum TaxID=431041 RepID=A0A164YV88_9SYNE|nr:hypothetical protein [Candidatus Synechococcus spongiarum]SAY38380.1 hypothetical protein FLM9_238 [Candidatus Synechococcus spongiarum]
MPLIPRWRFMTSEAKALVRTMGISIILLVVVLVVFRTLVGLLWPMVLVGFLLWLLLFRR